jgi:signal transduction histidine kinase
MMAIPWNRDAFTPRQVTNRVARMGIFIGCLVLLAVLFSAWLLPTPFSAAITLFAIAVTVFTALEGAIDPLTAKFQFTAVVVTACLSEMTVRSLVARERAQAATTDQLRRFTADAAHELRNPLSALQSELEITLRQERTSDELTATVRLALKNTQRLVKISESLLTLSRSDAGGLMTSVTRIDLSDVLEEAYARWEGHASAMGVRLSKTLRCEASLEGDPLLLGRLFDNLLENALAHTPRNGVVSVDMTATPSGGCAVTITDNGPGIPAPLRPVVFERFARGDSSRSRRTGGAGLGLAICAAIVAAHKGTITIDDEFVSGTRIVVRLPVTELSERV